MDSKVSILFKIKLLIYELSTFFKIILNISSF